MQFIVCSVMFGIVHACRKMKIPALIEYQHYKRVNSDHAHCMTINYIDL
jgi:hypothetical protein